MTCVIAILVYGLTGSVFGAMLGVTGIDVLAAKLRPMARVEVQKFVYDADDAMTEAAREKAWRCHIVGIGQSAGGNSVVRMAARLADEGIPVALLITFDPPDRMTHLLPAVPGNVAVAINHFQINEPMMGGGQLKRAPGNRNTFVLENRKNFLQHIPMARNESFHKEAIREIARLTRRRR